eukprot:7105764-Pyramimonas_sp.AAC.1
MNVPTNSVNMQYACTPTILQQQSISIWYIFVWYPMHAIMIAAAIGIRPVVQHCHERNLLVAQPPRRTWDAHSNSFSAPMRHTSMVNRMGRAERYRSINAPTNGTDKKKHISRR